MESERGGCEEEVGVKYEDLMPFLKCFNYW